MGQNKNVKRHRELIEKIDLKGTLVPYPHPKHLIGRYSSNQPQDQHEKKKLQSASRDSDIAALRSIYEPYSA